MTIGWLEILLRLVLAAIFGAAIGLERERKDWAAGIRTHMMVSMGSALIMLVSSFGFQDIVGASYAELDPSRVAAQIVSGIGFIGAGAILFRKPGTVMGTYNRIGDLDCSRNRHGYRRRYVFRGKHCDGSFPADTLGTATPSKTLFSKVSEQIAYYNGKGRYQPEKNN
jgi:hypothetical protein